MIIEIFLTFTILAVVLSVLGRVLNYELLIIFGFLIFGIMSAPLLNSNVEFKTGANITTNYTYEAGQLLSSSDYVTYDYEAFDNSVWFGIFFIFIALGSLFEYWYRGYGGRREED